MLADSRATGYFDAYKGVVQASPIPSDEPLSQWFWLLRTTASRPPPWYNQRAYRTWPQLPPRQVASETWWHSAPSTAPAATADRQDVARDGILQWIPTYLAATNRVAQSRTIDVSIIGYWPEVPWTDDVLLLRSVRKKHCFRTNTWRIERHPAIGFWSSPLLIYPTIARCFYRWPS